MLRGCTSVVFFALSACGIGVVGTAAPAGADASVSTDAADATADDGGSFDAAALTACLSVCTGPNAKCDYQGNCRITCDQPNSCKGSDVRCPNGVPCIVVCGAGACDNVKCGQSSTCDVQCNGADACKDIDCRAGAHDNDPPRIRGCAISCTGANACHDITALATEPSTIKCDVDNSCHDVKCAGTSCTLAGQAHPTGRCCAVSCSGNFDKTSGGGCF